MTGAESRKKGGPGAKGAGSTPALKEARGVRYFCGLCNTSFSSGERFREHAANLHNWHGWREDGVE